MATTSITNAVILKYAALDAANFPDSMVPRIDFGGIVQVSASLQVRLPYVRLQDGGREVKSIDFERNALVTTKFVFEIYASGSAPTGGTPLADVDAMVRAIRLNGGTVGQGLGFDYGTLTDLTFPEFTHQIIPVSEPRFLDPQTDTNGFRVHGARLEYRVSVLEKS